MSKRRHTQTAVATVLLVAALLAGASRIGTTKPPEAIVPEVLAPVAGAVPSAELRVLSYNVEGLPWPVARGRTEAADAIAKNLRSLREQGRQPQVVALQEAFSAAAKEIGREAGYSYAAFGPAAGLSGAAPVSVQDRDFVAHASVWHGETLGKYVDSGLAIFSDYPILWVKRVAFPAYACAGWDCMANKGVLAIAVQAPGSAKPLIVVDTHLNARAASGTPVARSDYAFRRQIDTLAVSVRQFAPVGDRIVMAGDFNISHDAARSAYFNRQLIGGDGLKIAAVEHSCGHACRIVGPVGETEAAKSMIAFKAGTTATLAPLGTVASFGRMADGGMLSDHIGLAMRFRLRA